MIAILDYGLGNLTSVKNALDMIGVENTITSNASTIKKADALILPGVGAAQEGMKNLQTRNLIPLLKEEIKKGKPFLGICLGMQLLFTKSEEGNTDCLSIIQGTVKRFKTKLKVPQIGWNTVEIMNYESGIMNQTLTNNYFYFVHSYYCEPSDKKTIAGTTNYDRDFCSIVAKENVYGVQFHPEKSGNTGLQLLRNFSNRAIQQ